jgi:small conductance mechanosensitive channel
LVEKGEAWAHALVAMLPNFALATFIVVAAVIGSRWIAQGVQRGLDQVSHSKQITRLLSKLVRVVVLAAGIFAALGVLQLDKTVTSLLAGVGILGLALGFAFQDIAANFVSGVLMAIRRPFGLGDIIRTNDHFGTVIDINLRATVLREFSGKTIIVPNKEVFQSAIINYSVPEGRRVELEVGVSYGDDLDRARTLAMLAAEGLDCRDKERPVELYYTGFGDSSIDFSLYFWLKETGQPEYLEARSQAVMAVKKAFDEGGITIPFPIRTLDFGILGGQKLNEVLPQISIGASDRAAE